MKNEYLILLPETRKNNVDAYELVYHLLKTQKLDHAKPFRFSLLKVPFFETKTAEPNSMYLMINFDGLKAAPKSIDDVYKQRNCMTFSIEDENGQCMFDSFDEVNINATYEIKEICRNIIVENFGIPKFFIDADNATTMIDRETCEDFFKNNLHLQNYLSRGKGEAMYFARNSNDIAKPDTDNENPLFTVKETVKNILMQNKSDLKGDFDSLPTPPPRW